MDQQNERIKELKSLIESPRHLIYFFDTLKSEVDICFLTQKNKDINQSKVQDINKKWKQIVDKIVSFEKECYKNRFKGRNFAVELNELKLKSFNSSEMEFEINCLENEILQSLFSNKSIFFLNENIGYERILIVNNHFFFNNSFSDLEIVDNGNLTLEFINLQHVHNKIKNSNDHIIEVKIDLTTETKLSLDQKRIHSIDKNIFQELNNLKELNLCNNSISTIKSFMFQGLLNLEDLNLFNNTIDLLEVDCFQGLVNLKSLNLCFNQLQIIRANSFQGLSNLIRLSIANNRIISIEENAFIGLASLKRLFLNNNKINSINRKIFNGLKNLTVFKLIDNQIENISSDTFEDLIYLEELNLMGNRIGSIEPNIFKSLVQLKKLYLGDNKIKFIKASYFQDLKDLKNVQIDEDVIFEGDFGFDINYLYKT